jgi:hypothetical protein
MRLAATAPSTRSRNIRSFPVVGFDMFPYLGDTFVEDKADEGEHEERGLVTTYATHPTRVE